MKGDILLYTVNTDVATTADSLVPLGGVVRRRGCGITLLGNTLNIREKGYYEISVSATMTASAAGTVTLTAQYGGTEIPGATATETFTTALTEVRSMAFSAVVRVECPCDGGITLEVSGTADADFENIAVEVVRV